ncbi:hypothetical protein Cgig2_025357 [Carnegiea gigantea]|uniref:Uncharacterized protein n=1 Tax=Carnegiea gigantea TaxID=171969 RepID=A0A9Q1GV86_9CARY|nr:hypothetical protein Cgig2_025357 [Carnegiea gigantea]
MVQNRTGLKTEVDRTGPNWTEAFRFGLRSLVSSSSVFGPTPEVFTFHFIFYRVTSVLAFCCFCLPTSRVVHFPSPLHSSESSLSSSSANIAVFFLQSRLSHSVTLQVSSFRETATVDWRLPRPEFSPVGGGISSLSPLQFIVGLTLSLADFSLVVSGSKNLAQNLGKLSVNDNVIDVGDTLNI